MLYIGSPVFDVWHPNDAGQSFGTTKSCIIYLYFCASLLSCNTPDGVMLVLLYMGNATLLSLCFASCSIEAFGK